MTEGIFESSILKDVLFFILVGLVAEEGEKKWSENLVRI